MESINVWATLVAAASAFVLGGIWYGPMFKHAWCKAAGVDPDKPPGHPAKVFGTAFAFSLVAATVFGWFLGPSPDVYFALGMGVMVGLGYVGTSFGINYQFAGRPFVLWAIDAGYHTLQFALYALVFSLWP